jgi:hypothetical protein
MAMLEAPKHFSEYQTKQFERGVTYARENDGRLKPTDADADSASFMRGFAEEKFDIDFGRGGDGMDGFEPEIENALSVLGLKGADYYWPLRMLDRKLFSAILDLAMKITRGPDDEEF